MKRRHELIRFGDWWNAQEIKILTLMRLHNAKKSKISFQQIEALRSDFYARAVNVFWQLLDNDKYRFVPAPPSSVDRERLAIWMAMLPDDIFDELIFLV